MKLSVLVGSRDRIEVLSRCVESILAQRYSNLEILVLDDASIHHSFDGLRSAAAQDERLSCFRADEPLGVAGGRNFLMQQATGDIFCVIDDDAYFDNPGCLSRIAAAFETHPNLGILATKVLDYQAGRVDLLVPFNLHSRHKNPGLTETPQLVSYYLGTCHAIHRRVIERCGGYRDDLVFGEEELDLSYRVIEAGLEIRYRPEVVVHHHPQPSVVGQRGDRRRAEVYYHVRNRFFLAYRYLPWKYIPTYLAIWLGKYGVRAVRQRTVSQFLGGAIAGVSLLKTLRRTPLSPQAIEYLEHHYGRLWY